MTDKRILAYTCYRHDPAFRKSMYSMDLCTGSVHSESILPVTYLSHVECLISTPITPTPLKTLVHELSRSFETGRYKKNTLSSLAVVAVQQFTPGCRQKSMVAQTICFFLVQQDSHTTSHFGRCNAGLVQPPGLGRFKRYLAPI